jgi:hypothetical protein
VAGDARRDAKGGGAVIYLVLLVVFAVGFVAACLESSLKNWEEESDDPR